jgi:hypothetical protein
VKIAGHDYIRGFENGIQNIGIVAESGILQFATKGLQRISFSP